MSIIYRNEGHLQNDITVNNIFTNHEEQKSSVFYGEKIRSRTKSGGFVAWPENISTTFTDTIDEMSKNRTRSGGFIAWPK